MSILVLKDSLHMLSSILQGPVIIALLLFICLTIMEFASVLVERLFERRHIKIDVADLLNTMQKCDTEKVSNKITTSSLLARHKTMLLKLLASRTLQSSAGKALASQLLSEQEIRYERILSITDFLVKLAPMLGLMGTLIPLGPGLIALGQGDIKMLAGSLLVAFDSTIAGLAIAGVAFVISRWRKLWYEKDMAILETLTEGLLGGIYGESISN